MYVFIISENFIYIIIDECCEFWSLEKWIKLIFVLFGDFEGEFCGVGSDKFDKLLFFLNFVIYLKDFFC